MAMLASLAGASGCDDRGQKSSSREVTATSAISSTTDIPTRSGREHDDAFVPKGANLERQRQAIEGLERGVRETTAASADIVQELERAKRDFEAAEERRRKTQTLIRASEEELTKATGDFEAAKKRWEYFQTLVILAAAVDANNLEEYRKLTGVRDVSSLRCEDGMSTAAFRRLLASKGVNLVGKDIDHIVPRSLGGADHPANYQILSSSKNRSLGNAWNATKCADAGAKCAGAIAVSRRCGGYTGTGY